MLLECISGEKLPEIERGKTRIHRITNVQKAINFLYLKGVANVGIAAEGKATANAHKFARSEDDPNIFGTAIL